MRKLRLMLLGAILVGVALFPKDHPQANDRECQEDPTVPASNPALWSTRGGRAEFASEDGEPFVRFIFEADPGYLRFDRDAALRAVAPRACLDGEPPLALEFEARVSHVLTQGNEFNLMLRGRKNFMLSGVAVPSADQWSRVRVVIPADAPKFDALHFGAGAAWARAFAGQTVRMDVRRVILRLRTRLQRAPPRLAEPTSVWRNPDDPKMPDERAILLTAPGAPVFAVVDFPRAQAGALRMRLPPGISVRAWLAEWRDVEQKRGVIERRAIRLLPYDGAHVPAGKDDRRRFWLRFEARDNGARRGTIELRFANSSATKSVEALPIVIPASRAAFQMYYQMNERWKGYGKYEKFYRDAPRHFAQLAALGFTGVHLAEEPLLTGSEDGYAADFERPGRYWQSWPLSLHSLSEAMRGAGFRPPLIWEGLRVFMRDDKWPHLQPCGCANETPMPGVGARMTQLAAVAAGGWKSRGGMPYLSVGDEPGVHSAEEVARVKAALRDLKRAGYRTYLTTHARMYDSFHELAPFLDINALHAEDVTDAAHAVARSGGGSLWIYNGGSFNVSAPGHDRFFAGLYGWLARAEGVIQWVYTRPSMLADPLDLRTRLADDAQFYALPGAGDEPAATPALLGMAAGIADRRLLDAADRMAEEDAQLRRYLDSVRARLALPSQPNEYTPARLREQVALSGLRDELLRKMAR